MNDQAIAIGVDIGGSKMVLGVVWADGSISEETRVATKNQSPNWVMEQIAAYARARGPGLPVGVAANGPVDPDGVVRYGTFIPWDGYPLAAKLKEALGVSIFVQNDVTVAAWGEYALDPAKRSVVVIAVGTGIGGGAVIEGRLLVGKGAGMEIGHIPGKFSTRLCVCGKVGCLEAVASGSAVAAEYQARLSKDSTLPGLTAAPEVVAAARAGDELATEVIYEAGVALGEAAALLTSVLDPERIVFTGGLMHGAGALLFEPARAAFLRRLAPPNIGSKDILEMSSTTSDPIVFGAGNRAAQLASASLRFAAYPYA